MLLARPADLAPRAPWPDMPLVVWPAALALWGPGEMSSKHAHHAMHLMFRREGTLSLRVGAARTDTRAAGVLVGPDVSHSVDARGGDVLLLFVEPESQDGVRLRASLTGEVRLFDEAERDTLLAGLPREGPLPHAAMGPWMESTLAALAGPSQATPSRMHPRVRKLLRHLRAEPAPDDTSLESLSQMAGLSSGRLMHVFTESTGVPLRPYLLWLKLQRAAGAIAAGRSLGEAAHAAGFSDAAHLTRTFRRMFGTAPSLLQRRSQFVQARARASEAS